MDHNFSKSHLLQNEFLRSYAETVQEIKKALFFSTTVSTKSHSFDNHIVSAWKHFFVLHRQNQSDLDYVVCVSSSMRGTEIQLLFSEFWLVLLIGGARFLMKLCCVTCELDV